MHQLKALFFDVDGTLALTEQAGHLPAFNQTFKDFGLSWNWDSKTYCKLLTVSGGKERIEFYLNSLPIEQQQQFSKLAQIHSCNNLNEFIKKIYLVKNKLYKEVAKKYIKFRPGIKELILDAKSNKIKVAIITTTAFDNVVNLLQDKFNKSEIKKFSHNNTASGVFDLIVAGDIVANKKPAPDIYEFALKKMNLLPEEVVAFEDSYNGVCATQLQSHFHYKSILTMVTYNDYTKNDNFLSASFICNQLVPTKNNDFIYKTIPKMSATSYDFFLKNQKGITLKFVKKFYEVYYQ